VRDVLILDYGITTLFVNNQWSVSDMAQFKLAPCLIIKSILSGRIKRQLSKIVDSNNTFFITY